MLGKEAEKGKQVVKMFSLVDMPSFGHPRLSLNQIPQKETAGRQPGIRETRVIEP